ncbi:MAG: ATP-binding cassette domain-containing protein [Kurthia sp.]|nr:ATP-binding cassette domain-containing protein [Candidatus Kurthia equi]
MGNYQLENMSVSINGEMIFSTINLHMLNAQIYGIVGRVNSGKTLLLNGLANNLSTYQVKPIVKKTQQNFHAELVSTTNLLLKSTALNNMRILSSREEKLSDDDVKWFLEKVGLSPQDSRNVETFSKMEKTLLAVALLLAENPSVILFDEPYIGFEIAEIKQMNQLLKLLKDMNICLVVTSVNEALLQPICQVIYRLNNGQLQKNEAIYDKKE